VTLGRKAFGSGESSSTISLFRDGEPGIVMSGDGELGTDRLLWLSDKVLIFSGSIEEKGVKDGENGEPR